MSTDFYGRLRPIADFTAITDPRSFTLLPEGWHLVVTDVRGSTAAIAAGRYKEVNMVGAASIVAMLNLAGPVEIPFVFGGDGATLAVPPALVEPARAVLAALRALARRSYGLELRAGMVPHAVLLAAGRQVRIARLTISEHYAQAAFSGGLAYAEALIKDPVAGVPYLVNEGADQDAADLSGLECRWQDIPSRHGETVSLLVTAAPDSSPGAAAATLREVIGQIGATYGTDKDYHPLAEERLRLTLSPSALGAEARLRAPGGVAGLAYLARTWATNLLVKAYTPYERLSGRQPWWDRYRALVFSTADYKKYDDTLRMVLSGAPRQRARLEAYLERRYAEGRLAYGLHVADRALMTCLVFERMGRQVHFVDGADGGYALAARALKARLGALGRAAPPAGPASLWA